MAALIFVTKEWTGATRDDELIVVSGVWGGLKNQEGKIRRGFLSFCQYA